jgi:hypothetical protein
MANSGGRLAAASGLLIESLFGLPDSMTMRAAIRMLSTVLAGAIVASGCRKSPTAPSPLSPSATLVVSSAAVIGEQRAEGGFVYRTVVHLTETSGVTATITAVNLTVLNGTTALFTTRFDQIAPSTGNTCPAHSSVDTRELVATDADTSHAFGTNVRVDVVYSDGTSTGMTAIGTGTIPPLAAACAYTVSNAGRINVSESAGQIGVTITRVSGSCAWQATTDVDWITPRASSGDGGASLTFNYTSNSTFVGRLGTITFSWAGGSAQLQVSQNPQPVVFCVVTFTVGGQSPLNNVPAAGGSFTADLTPVPGMPPGVCAAWSAAASGPVTIIGPASGTAMPASINFTVAANTGSAPRSGFINVTFNGSGANLTINQVAGP